MDKKVILSGIVLLIGLTCVIALFSLLASLSGANIADYLLSPFFYVFYILPIILVLIEFVLIIKFFSSKRTKGLFLVIVILFIVILPLTYLSSISTSGCSGAITPGKNMLTDKCKFFRSGCLDFGYGDSDYCGKLLIDNKDDSLVCEKYFESDEFTQEMCKTRIEKYDGKFISG